MTVLQALRAERPSLSFEFFPPKTESGWYQLRKTMEELSALTPDFVSVTYGAGGGTRERTHQLVEELEQRGDMHPVPHLTCVSHSEAEISHILDRYAQVGVETILALGGDPPKSLPDYDRGSDRFRRARDLVEFARTHQAENPGAWRQGLAIGVAGFPEGHPATPDRMAEMLYLREKVEAGADYICTQLFFDNRDFLDFRDRCRIAGIRVPILPGIMAIGNRKSFERIPGLALGARYPARLLGAIEKAKDDNEVARIGLDWALDQIDGLLAEGVPGVHLYTLNESETASRLAAGLR